MVTARGSGKFLDAPGMATAVFTADDISRMQVRTLPELLESVASAHILERGSPGSQADISIRGSSPEGVLLLVNGVPVRDPQTGHFLMDLPLRFSGIERVEVLSGGGSAFYGSSATGGVVNIITRNQSGVGGSVSAGSFGTLRAEGFFPLAGERGSAVFGASCARSDGYRKGTDGETVSADGSGKWSGDRWVVRGNAGIVHKEFGAQGFYSPYPSYERIMSVQGGINAIRALGDHSLLRMIAGGRGHADEFTLVRNRPSLYRNTHYNRVFLLGMEYVSRSSGGGSLTVGAEGEREGIASGNLGRRSDGMIALYGDVTGTVRRCVCAFTLRYDSGYRSERIISPGVGIVLPVSNVYRVRARVERSFRSPTYTERFYEDPTNRGNPDLHSEQSVSAEAGVDRNTPGCSAVASVFAVKTSEVIDWVRNSGETVWSAANHGRFLTFGAEGRAVVSLVRGWRLTAACMVMRRDVRDRAGSESKYALNTAERSVVSALDGVIAANVACSAAVRYERMRSGNARAPVDVRISRKCGPAVIRFTARNIGNERYEEIPGLPAPGRWFTVELEYVR